LSPGRRDHATALARRRTSTTDQPAVNGRSHALLSVVGSVAPQLVSGTGSGPAHQRL